MKFWLNFERETNEFLNFLGIMSHCFLDAALICKFGANIGLIWYRFFRAALQVLEQTVTVFRGSIARLFLYRTVDFLLTRFWVVMWIVQQAWIWQHIRLWGVFWAATFITWYKSGFVYNIVARLEDLSQMEKFKQDKI